jgi:hypothetical protein
VNWLRQWADRFWSGIVPGRRATGTEATTPAERPRHPEYFATADTEEEAAWTLYHYVVEDMIDTDMTPMEVIGDDKLRFELLKCRGGCSGVLAEGQGASRRWRIVVCSEGLDPEADYWFEEIEGDFADFRDLLQPDTDHH